jgi:hypothetical protein
MSESKTMMINDVEYVRKSDIQQVNFVCHERKEGPWEIGKSYLIRTVTMIQHGRLIDVTDKELILEDASWIADTGRFHDFLMGKIQPNEVEPFAPGSPVIVSRGALIDAQKMSGKFLTQK